MKRLGIYLMAGPETLAVAEAAVEAGADFLEIGFPFSDPLADGPVIRRAAERALARGMRTGRCLDLLAELRARVDVPLVPMTYAPILEAYGRDRFAADARAAGAETLIVADLPVGAWPEVPRVHLVAPTTSAERIRAAGEATDGWLYLVSVTGTTGPRADLPPELPGLAHRAREATAVPLVAGFGISTPEQAEGVAALVDGIVVGSAAILAAEAEGPAGVGSLVAALRRATDRVGTVGSRP